LAPTVRRHPRGLHPGARDAPEPKARAMKTGPVVRAAANASPRRAVPPAT